MAPSLKAQPKNGGSAVKFTTYQAVEAALCASYTPFPPPLRHVFISRVTKYDTAVVTHVLNYNNWSIEGIGNVGGANRCVNLQGATPGTKIAARREKTCSEKDTLCSEKDTLCDDTNYCSFPK